MQDNSIQESSTWWCDGWMKKGGVICQQEASSQWIGAALDPKRIGGATAKWMRNVRPHWSPFYASIPYNLVLMKSSSILKGLNKPVLLDYILKHVRLVKVK